MFRAWGKARKDKELAVMRKELVKNLRPTVFKTVRDAKTQWQRSVSRLMYYRNDSNFWRIIIFGGCHFLTFLILIIGGLCIQTFI